MFSETISRILIHQVGQTAYFGFVAVLLFVIPLVLIWLVIEPLIRERMWASVWLSRWLGRGDLGESL